MCVFFRKVPPNPRIRSRRDSFGSDPALLKKRDGEAHPSLWKRRGGDEFKLKCCPNWKSNSPRHAERSRTMTVKTSPFGSAQGDDPSN
jgi:hypothetical protein